MAFLNVLRRFAWLLLFLNFYGAQALGITLDLLLFHEVCSFGPQDFVGGMIVNYFGLFWLILNGNGLLVVLLLLLASLV